MKPRRLNIGFPDEAIADLHRRLDSARWPDSGHDPGWDMGMDVATLRDIVSYWRHEYDWPAALEELNLLEHYTVEIDGESLHFVHYRGEPGAHPLLLIHGWPGSFVEFLDAAEVVRSAGYDLIVPSLPGFALSDPPRSRGVHGGVMAERLHRLMGALGHARYGVQGGDWGSVIGLALANRHPEAVTGIHINLVPGLPPLPVGVEPTEEEAEWRAWREAFNDREIAYYDLQATKPDTVAYAFADSPVGLLAWILDKFWAWSTHDDDLWAAVDRDRFLTNVMLYWLPNRVASAGRIYFEMNHTDEPVIGGYVSTPTGYLRMPGEPWAPPLVMAKRVANIVHFTEADRGGHFAALEQPEIFAEDVAAFFSGIDWS